MTVRLGLVGAGLIGRRHATSADAASGVTLAAIADPTEAGRAFAAERGTPWVASLDEMLESGAVDGVILATPNQLHAEGALACIAAGLPVLVEKPLASDLAGARAIVAAAESAGVAVAVGHHRRHNPLIARAAGLIAEGRLGRIAAVHGTTWFKKPDSYFEAAWRTRAGAGPVYLNLIHDIDLLAHLCGPIEGVQALEAHDTRGFEVEDTAVMILRFASGALGTVTLSDTIAAPWSWELTAAENPAYPPTGQGCYWIGGTAGALSLPDLALWSHPEAQSWWAPISATRFPVGNADPLILQLEQFGRVIRGEERPLVSARDGFAALAAVEAVKTSARSGRMEQPETCP